MSSAITFCHSSGVPLFATCQNKDLSSAYVYLFLMLEYMCFAQHLCSAKGNSWWIPCTNPLCWSLIIVQPYPLPYTPISFNRSSRNWDQESLLSTSTTAQAIGNIWLFPYLPTAVNNFPQQYDLRKQPSTPIIGLHPCSQPFFSASRHTYILWKYGGALGSGLSTQILTVLFEFDLIISAP